MPQKGLSMRKIREVLRLRYDLGLLQHEIARSCSISQPSVNRYLHVTLQLLWEVIHPTSHLAS
jgi:DNA-binding transcriptional regulator LsrR (DeoR family)